MSQHISQYIQHIMKSILINYKMWTTLLASCYVLFYNESFHVAWFQYILCILYSYLAHRMAHEPLGFLVNRAHIYHHEHTDWTSHVIQVCVELAAVYSPIFLLYVVFNSSRIIVPFHPYIFMLFSFFYTSTHNINYGMLHVNKAHSKHHGDYSVNYGPDICDIIFGTKYPPDSIENTDHYIPNIIVATIITYLFRHFYESHSNKEGVKLLLVYVYLGICGVVGIFNVKQLFIEWNKYSKRINEEFDTGIQELIHKLKN